jgi:PAS domain S-box-containing protein
MHDEDAVIRNEQRFSLAAQATSDVIRDWNVESGSIWVSDSLTTLWGHALDTVSVTAEWWEAHIHPDDTARVHASLEHAFLGNEDRWSAEYRFRRGDGTYASVLDRGLILRRTDGTVIRMVATMQDMTPYVQAEQGQRMNILGRIAATMAHDFNNVLMGIQPFAELIRKRATDARMTQAANQILKSVTRGRRVTLDLLRITQMAAPSLRVIDLAPWLRLAAAKISALMSEKIAFSVTAPETPRFVSCDTSQLHQVLGNLAVNGQEAMPEGGTLTIALDGSPTDPSSVELTVSDTGSGIPPEVLPHIFEPLYTTKKSRTGLGLTVVHQIVARHGGTLSVESSQNEGTTFRIRLPRVLSAIDTAATEKPGVFERILLVEDDETVAEGLVELLGLEDLLVEVVSHGALVVEAVERFAPHAVILDIGLPDMNGVEVYERIAARWPDLAVIFSSGNADTHALSPYFDRPRVRFLHKPYDVEALLRVLREIA